MKKLGTISDWIVPLMQWLSLALLQVIISEVISKLIQ